MLENLKIRATNSGDLEDIYEIMSCPGVVRNTMQLPYVSIDERRKWLEGLGPDDHMLVAELDGKVIGNMGLHCRRGRLAHMGHIGMSVHDDYQGQGIGTALMEAVVDMADNWLNLKRLELDVYIDNEPGVRLYKKFGFEIEGTRKSLAFRDGEFVDAYSMARLKE